jgi:hypothetical protein
LSRDFRPPNLLERIEKPLQFSGAHGAGKDALTSYCEALVDTKTVHEHIVVTILEKVSRVISESQSRITELYHAERASMTAGSATAPAQYEPAKDATPTPRPRKHVGARKKASGGRRR